MKFNFNKPFTQVVAVSAVFSSPKSNPVSNSGIFSYREAEQVYSILEGEFPLTKKEERALRMAEAILFER